jgi:hypothetical protein
MPLNAPVDREAEYDVRLKQRVAQWEAKHVEQAAELRRGVLAQAGLTTWPEAGLVRAEMLECLYCEEVRKLNPKWPTLRAWMRGAA